MYVSVSLDSKVVLKRSVSLVNADLAFNSSREQKVEIYQRLISVAYSVLCFQDLAIVFFQVTRRPKR